MSITKRIQLSAMMFMQFMIVAAFFPQLSAYLGNIKVSDTMMATIMSTMAIGAIFSPIVGMVADRFMNGEKVLFILNAIVAVFLFLAAATADHTMLFVYLLVAMFCYMPTWGLTSSIAMTNSTTEAFPGIRVWGSIGWVCAAVFAIVGSNCFGKDIDGTNIPLYCGGAVALVAAFASLLIPATPPSAKGQPMSVVDAFGLRAFGMLKDRNTAIFMICSCFWMFCFVIYWLFFADFLSKGLNIKDITVSMNVGQVSEMLFILLLPFAIKLFGLKNTMALGIAAMVLRYVFCAFSLDVGGLYWGAIVVHGIIFGFFFVAAQMYIANKAPKELQAQAQGLFFCLAFGVSQFVGAYFTKMLTGFFTTEVVAEAVAATSTSVEAAAVAVKSIDWKSIFLAEAGMAAVLLVFFYAFFKDDTAKSE